MIWCMMAHQILAFFSKFNLFLKQTWQAAASAPHNAMIYSSVVL